MNLDHPLFGSNDFYTVDALNDIVNRFAANDDLLKGLHDALSTILSNSPGIVPTPAELKTAVDAMYDAGSVVARNWVVDPPDRSLQEIDNLSKIEPMVDLIAGTKLNPQQWLPMLRLFSMLKGMIYLVEDGPDYDQEPTYLRDGSFFFTVPTNPDDAAQHLLVSASGEPLQIGGPVYRPLPAGSHPITLIEFLLRRLEFQRLRQVYAIGAFEAGIDHRYNSSMPHDLVAHAFEADAFTLTKRMPCGFATAGKFLHLRSQAGNYRDSNLNIFRSNQPNGGVEERLIMDASMVQTPMGLFRLPKCVLRFDHLITDAMRQTSPNGDPTFFIGLRVRMSVVKRTNYSNGVATPAVVTTTGCGSGIVPLELNTIGPDIHNHPLHVSGAMKDRYPLLAVDGHEQGRIIGHIQEDGSNTFSQFSQITVDVVATPMSPRGIFDAMSVVPTGQKDEIGKIGEHGTDTDTAPWRAIGIGPRHVLKLVLPDFPGMNLDIDQGLLTGHTFTPAENTITCVLPIGLYLAKNQRPFGTNNINGCTTRFESAWAIRRITSAQTSLNTIIFEDVDGGPEAFPADFVGAELTVWHADGTTTKTTIVERVGDRLARIPADALAKVVPGDIATIDRRQPSTSGDGAYDREVGVTNFVDLRLRSHRLVDTKVDQTIDTVPSPDVSWTRLTRSKPDSLVEPVMACFADEVAGIGSKLRWHYAQQFLSLASQRRDMVEVTGTSSELQTAMLRWVSNYEANKDHEWIVGEGAIIHWPEKNPVTKIPLRRYAPPVLPGNDDAITIEEVAGIGPAPVLTTFVKANDHLRYPLRFINTLVFANERSFQIPGHNKLAGSFRLHPEDTWIVDNAVSFRLYQMLNRNGLKQKVLLGSFDVDWTRATSFTNATGVFRIDGDAQYNPSTGYVVINYNQVIDFTSEEPGILEPVFTYHDLSQVHPIYRVDIGRLGLQVSHLFEAKGFSVAGGSVQEMPDTMRLEGLSLSDGIMHIRLHRDDCYKVIAAKGALRFKWVLRGIPWITITKVVPDAKGQPASVEYTASTINETMTTSTLLENDSRCVQEYLPCKVKYGWVDIGQTNIHTEAHPQNESPKYGFFEKRDVLSVDKALTVPGPVTVSFKPSDVDYRFLAPFTTTVGMEPIRSVAIARNHVTRELKVFVGAYATAAGVGDAVSLFDPFILGGDQKTVHLYDQSMDGDWILEFAGNLVAVDDEPLASAPSGKSKLMLAGYWYAGHTVSERIGSFLRLSPGVVQFGGLNKVAGNWRLGDVPAGFLYRGNNLLWGSRTRPL